VNVKTRTLCAQRSRGILREICFAPRSGNKIGLLQLRDFHRLATSEFVDRAVKNARPVRKNA